jgi:dipeptidyl aminopeptidase/acylaminoacyl peptidase
MRQNTLLAARLDLAKETLVGEPIPIAEDVMTDSGNLGAGAFSTSAAGLIAYRAGSLKSELTWFDRAGEARERLPISDESVVMNHAISPDGQRVAVQRSLRGNISIWMMDAIRATPVTSGVSDQYPTWSDRDHIVFGRRPAEGGPMSLYVRSLNRVDSETLLKKSSGNTTPYSVSRDGRFLLYLERDPKTVGDLWVLPMAGGQKGYPVVNSNFEDRLGQFSPDGHWIAYMSDRSGKYEVYVREFSGSAPSEADSARVWPVSTAGGIAPRWSDDGKELYYIAPDAKLMAVPVIVKGGMMEPGAPKPLFQTRILFGGTSSLGTAWQYDVSRDGRFLINTITDAAAGPITLVQNWTPKP